MGNILTSVADKIDGINSEAELLIRLLVSVCVFLILLIFKNQISRGLCKIFCRLFLRKSENAQKAVKESVYKPLSYFIAVSGVYIASEIVFPSGDINIKVLVLLKICFICLAAWSGVNLVNNDSLFMKSDDFSNSRLTAVKFINNIVKIAIVTIALLLVLEQFGISATKLFAALGIGGVAVAFACKDMVENMLSGFIIIFDKPFEVGDFIELNGDSGIVTDIKIRTTRLTGVDGCEKIYPNTSMANSSITNWTKMQKRAVSQTIAVNYSTDSKKISSVCDDVKDLLLANENVIKNDVRVNFTAFGDHALEISLFFYIDKTATPEYLAVKNKINTQLKSYFDENDVSLAFESKTVYFGDELKIKK